MKKGIKYAGIGIGVIVVLGLIVPFLIPTKTYKGLILKEANSRINGTLELADVRIKFLPVPGLKLKGVKISNTTGEFAGQPIITAGEISANVQLLPLLSKNAIVSLKLINPEVFYRTGKNGKTNIDELLKNTALDEKNPTSGFLVHNAYAEVTKPAVEKSAWKVMISGVEIKDGHAVMSKEDEASTEVKRLDLQLSETRISLAAALLGGDTQNIKLSGKLALNMAEKKAEAKEWGLSIGDAKFHLNAKVNYNDPISADINLSLPKATIGDLLAADPRILKSLPKDISKDALSKTPLNVNLEAAYDKSGVAIKKLIFMIGDTKLVASGNVSMENGMLAGISADIDPIKIAELKSILPALKPVAGVSDPKVSLRIDGPLQSPKKLVVSGHVESKNVKYQEYEISNFKADVKYGNEKINLSSITGNLYSGTLKGNGSLGMAGEPTYDADVIIDGVDMSQVPATKILLKGKGTLKVNATGRGTEAVAIKKNLKANGSIYLANGDIPSLKLGEKIFGNQVWDVLARANVGLNDAKLKELRSLDASCKDFSLTFKIDNGVITTPDIKWQHAKYRATLNGTVTMDERLNYKGEFSLLKPTTDILVANQSARNVLVNKSGELMVPFNVAGNVSDPKVTPDEKYLAGLFTKAAAAVLAGKAKEVIQNKVAPNVQEGGKKLLQGIFGK